MNIRADEFFLLTRGYDIDPDKLKTLEEKMRSASQAVTKNEADLKKFSKVVDLSRISASLFDCYESQDAKLRNELRTAVADYVAYLGGNLYTSALEAYKDSDKPQYEIDALFIDCLMKTELHPLEDDINIFSFPDCNTPADVFEKAKQDILDRMAITIPRPLESYMTRIPNFILWLDDKGAKEIFDGQTKAGEKREIKLNSPGRKSMIREIEFVKQEYGEAIEEWGLDLFEWGVALSLCSLWYDGTKAFTLQTIASSWEDLEKGTDLKAGEVTLQRIKQAIIKLSRWVKINYLPEAKAYPGGFIYHPGEVYQYEGPLFFVRIDTTMKLNNQVTHEGIKLVAEPILLELAKKKAQYTKLPNSVFKTPGSLTVKKVELEFYLLGRLEQMRRSKKKKAKDIPLTIRTILWETLFAKTGIDAKATPSVKKKQMEKALAMLDAWKQAGELLLDYASTPEAIYIAVEEPHLKEIQKKKIA